MYRQKTFWVSEMKYFLVVVIRKNTLLITSKIFVNTAHCKNQKIKPTTPTILIIPAANQTRTTRINNNNNNNNDKNDNINNNHINNNNHNYKNNKDYDGGNK